MIAADKTQCCGCSACESICSQKCISMVEDKEGFLYPNIDMKKCVSCNLCEKVCPVLNVEGEHIFEQEAYVVQNIDERVCLQSTSGGAFTAIANEVIEEGGIVFGAAFDEDFNVKHIGTTSKDEIQKFRNSKYVQSDIRGTYSEVQKRIEEGQLVCYSGTPCQIEGLKRYLGKESDRLITVDVVCHAVSSPLVWKKYVSMQKEKLGNSIANIRFRDKQYGYKYSSMSFTDKSGKRIYSCGVESDLMCRAFFSNICDRPSCYSCVFKKQYRVSDFTIWDCFQVGRFSRKLDNDKGASRVLVHSDEGKKLFEKIKDNFEYIQISPNDAVEGAKEMFESVSNNSRRKKFMEEIATLDTQTAFARYFPDNFKVKIERYIRMLLLKMRIYGIAKKIVVYITHKY